MPFQNWPYSDLGNINLDWMLRKIKTLEHRIKTIESGGESGETVTNNYFNTSRFGYAFESPIAFSDAGIDLPSGYTLQGGCRNNKTQQILLLFRSASTGQTACVILNDSWIVVRVVYANLGHANDVTYNPAIDGYIVADGTSNERVYMLDEVTLTVTRTIEIGGVQGAVASIDYFDGGYYLTTVNVVNDNSTFYVYHCDSDFANVEAVTQIPAIVEYEPLHTPAPQGACVCGDYYVSTFWCYPFDTGVNSFTRLWFINRHTGDIESFYDVRNQGFYDEPECAIPENDTIRVIGYVDTNLTMKRIYIDGVPYTQCISTDGVTYRTIDLIPVNSEGTCILAAGTSPTGQALPYVYKCYGNNLNRHLTVTAIDSGATYFRTKRGGQWGAWLGSDGDASIARKLYTPSASTNNVKLTHGSTSFTGLLMVRSNQGLSDALFFVAGYGVGGTARDHITQIAAPGSGTSYNTSIVDNVITITSSQTIAYASIILLSGNLDEIGFSS